MQAVSIARPEWWASLWSALPLLALQATSVTGMLAIALIASRRAGRPMRDRPWLLGLLFGCVNFAIGWFVSGWMTAPIKPNLVIDVCLISGMLGGFPAALVTGVLSLFTRYVFAGSHGFGAVMAEAGLYFIAGGLLHRIVFPGVLARFNAGLVLSVWGVRVVVTYLGILAGHLVGYPPELPLADFIGLRSAVLPLSLVILAATLLLTHFDAQIDRQQAAEERRSQTDSLTGLPNRRALTDYLKRRAEGREVRSAWGSEGCLLIVQLSRLREVQVRHGPTIGSELFLFLSSPAMVKTLLAPLARYRPQLFQYGDFAVAIALEGASLEQVEKAGTVERFLVQLTDAILPHWPDLTFRCAVVNVAIGKEGEEIPYRSITLALNSLESGVAYFNDLLRLHWELDDEIEQALADWIGQGTAPVRYQPKIRLVDGQVAGAEALLRMQGRDGGDISPMRVISLCRQKRMLVELEWAVILAVVRFLGVDAASSTPQVPAVSVNITPETLSSPAFGERLARLLATSGIPGKRLRLELIEWSELVQVPDVQANIRVLDEAGVTLALDDFGIGYSTLMLLTQLPVAELKIDQVLVSSLASGQSRPIISMIVEAAARYGAIVVAEGVESAAVEAALKTLGVEYGQGFLYARALADDDFLAFIRARAEPRQALTPAAPASTALAR